MGVLWFYFRNPIKRYEKDGEYSPNILFFQYLLLMVLGMQEVESREKSI